MKMLLKGKQSLDLRYVVVDFLGTIGIDMPANGLVLGQACHRSL